MVGKMPKLFLTIIQDKRTIFIFLISVFLYCLKSGVSFPPDSGTYIHHSAIRIGLYPLTISIFQHLFKDYGFQVLVGFQILLGISAASIIAHFLKTTFNLPPLLHWVILSVFLIPFVVFKSANSIMSEGLAYPLFLLTSYFFLKGILEKKIKDLCLFSFFLFLLVLTRQQYLFFYGVAVAAVLFFMLFQRDFQKKGVFVLSIALSLGGIFISERAYHYVYHGSFSRTPFTGIQLIIRPLFLASQESYKSLQDPKQQQFVKEVLEEMIHQKISEPALRKYWAIEEFYVYYNTICHQICSPFLLKVFDDEIGKTHSGFEYYQMLDQETISIAFQLIKGNFLNYAASFILDVVYGSGGFSFLGLIFFISLLCFRNILWFHDKNPIYPAVIFSILIHFGNLAIICLVEPPLIRYTYSTGILLFSMLLIMGYQFSKNTLPSKTKPSCAA